MKNTQISGLIFLFAISTSAMSAGVITFNGTLVDETCITTVSSTGVTAIDSPTLTLPTLAVSAFPTVNSTAGKTPFTIHLKGANCTLANPTKYATPYFVYDINKVNAQGRVINTDAATGSSVDIEILNDANAFINLTANETSQTTSTRTVVDTDETNETNETDFSYYARYYAKAVPVVAGPVTGTLTYNVIYK